MDYLHACYVQPAHWGPGPSDTFSMRWYRAAPGANVYTYPHAFGTTVDAGTFVDTPGMVGELPVHYPTWSPTGPPLYDGSDPVVYNPALEFGADPAVMAVPCVDGVLGIVGDATFGFAPTVVVGGPICQCETQIGGIALVF